MITNAERERRTDLLRERNMRYKNMKKTHTSIIKKNTKKFTPEISHASTASTPRGVQAILMLFKKSRSIESFTSSGDIHL